MKSFPDHNNGLIKLLLYYLKKINRNIQDYGWLVALNKIFHDIAKPIYVTKELILYEINLNHKLPDSDKDGNIIYKFIDKTDQDYIEQIFQLEEWLERTLIQRLEENGLCLVALAGDEVIAFNIVARGRGELPLLKLRVVIDKNETWSEQISVKEKYRRKGIASGLRKKLYKELIERKVSSLYGHRAEYNIASKKSASRFIKKDLAKVRYKKLLWFEKIEGKQVENLINIEDNKKGTNQYRKVEGIKDKDGYFVVAIKKIHSIHDQVPQKIPNSIRKRMIWHRTR